MYGLPKVHKKDVPLRPILSMVGSVQHKLAKWLAELLQPVLNSFSKFSISDSFEFANFIRGTIINNDNKFMCSYDIKSLYTNIPLEETIALCADSLYRGNFDRPDFPEETFVELIKFATMSVEFSFNDIMYRQIDGVSMGSPLAPCLAGIFVGHLEQSLFQKDPPPFVISVM